MTKEHHYKTNITWTGNKGSGTKDYTTYERSYEVKVEQKTTILGSSDAPFRGDISKHNPEDLFLSSLSSCHMLWFLHLCADKGIVVVSYEDNAHGTMIENQEGGGRFTSVMLNPKVVINDSNQIKQANELHAEANRKCFIANSCNFTVHHHPICSVLTT